MSLSLLKLQMFKFQVCPCDMGKTKPTPGLDFDWGFTKLVFNLNEDIWSVGMKPSAGVLTKHGMNLRKCCGKSHSCLNFRGDSLSRHIASEFFSKLKNLKENPNFRWRYLCLINPIRHGGSKCPDQFLFTKETSVLSNTHVCTILKLKVWMQKETTVFSNTLVCTILEEPGKRR